ncbi:hypothetical protein BDD12DRAFT_932433 [Trichophaea hybrida]|nr:hypothetical protein BDD12DRAFT_932433 [Trichophaea hybrida]
MARRGKVWQNAQQKALETHWKAVIFSLVLLELVTIVGGNSIQWGVSPLIFMFQICSPARRLLNYKPGRPPLSAGFQITGPAWPAKAHPKAHEASGPVSNTEVNTRTRFSLHYFNRGC